MKKSYVLFASVLFALLMVFTGCDNKKNEAVENLKERMEADNDLKEMVKEFRRNLPIRYTNDITCTDVRLTSKAMEYVYTVSSGTAVPSKATVENIVEQQIDANEDFADMVENLVATNRDLVYRYEGYQKIVLKSKNLKKLIE